LFMHYAHNFPDKLSANIFFDTELSLDIYKHSDMFLMPSQFEPCGISQLISMKYGTIPIVRKTGGLADTVSHYDPETKTGNGFVFEDYDANGLMWALKQAIALFEDKEQWDVVTSNALASRFSSATSATKYINLYYKILGRHKHSHWLSGPQG